MRRRGRLRRRRRGGRRRDGVDRRDAPPGDPQGRPPRRHPARPAPGSGACTPSAGWCADGSDRGDRVAVITRRGRSRIGVAQSLDEASRWMEDVIRYALRAVG